MIIRQSVASGFLSFSDHEFGIILFVDIKRHSSTQFAWSSIALGSRPNCRLLSQRCAPAIQDLEKSDYERRRSCTLSHIRQFFAFEDNYAKGRPTSSKTASVISPISDYPLFIHLMQESCRAIET